ncbi:MAG: hypothetical protein M0Z88_08685, partial [Actinomycetota bacterium]|nr:hypothetical protein [Actinomycetota bacterium]
MDRVQTPLAAIAVSLVAAIAAWEYRPLILVSAAASLVCAWALINAHRKVAATASALEPGSGEETASAPTHGIERHNSFQEHLSNDPD